MSLRFDLYSNGYKVFWSYDKFPDGQIRIFADAPVDKVVCSVTNSQELDFFMQIGQTFYVKELQINYAYGSRSDKTDGKHCDVNSMFWNITDKFYREAKIRVLDPHGACPYERFGPEVEWGEYDLAVYPDESAESRQLVNPPNCATSAWTKERDQESGQIIKHSGAEAHGLKVIVMDDLCDGGATFVSMASSFNSPHLYVTHGVFSKGLKVLADAGFSKVVTTNSYHRDMVSDTYGGLELVVIDVFSTERFTPTEPGWYWMKAPGLIHQIVELVWHTNEQSRLVIWDVEGTHEVPFGADFRGPIRNPFEFDEVEK